MAALERTGYLERRIAGLEWCTVAALERTGDLEPRRAAGLEGRGAAGLVGRGAAGLEWDGNLECCTARLEYCGQSTPGLLGFAAAALLAVGKFKLVTGTLD